jgi:hypothetical protein
MERKHLMDLFVAKKKKKSKVVTAFDIFPMSSKRAQNLGGLSFFCLPFLLQILGNP